MLAPNVRGTLESEKERRGENRRKWVREPNERGGTQTRPSYLRVPIYRESNPSFPVRRGPRRFRRLNAINDLISVITVLIYCARARGVWFSWLWVESVSTMKRIGGREVLSTKWQRKKVLHLANNTRDCFDLTDKTVAQPPFSFLPRYSSFYSILKISSIFIIQVKLLRKLVAYPSLSADILTGSFTRKVPA